MKKTRVMRHAKKWQPYDFGYNLEVERAMFQKQADYFEKSNIAVGDFRRAEICRLLVRLLDIITNKDFKCQLAGGTIRFEKTSNSFYKIIGDTKWVDTVYINKKNAHRFISNRQFDLLSASSNFSWHALREAKAWYLYNKLRLYKMQDLWN